MRLYTLTLTVLLDRFLPRLFPPRLTNEDYNSEIDWGVRPKVPRFSRKGSVAGVGVGGREMKE